MDLLISAFILFICDSMILTPTQARRICNYCDVFRRCYNCYENVSCPYGTTIKIRKVMFGNVDFWFDNHYCIYNCKGDVAYSRTFTNAIEQLCNGQQVCVLSRWKIGTNWNLDIDYYCQAVTVPKTSPTIPSSTDTIIYESGAPTDSETTSTSTKENETISTKSTDAPPTPTSSATPGNDTSNTAESETGNSSSSDKFPVAIVASTVAAVIVAVFIVLVGSVCIKRRKANKEKTDSTRVQCNGRQNTTLVVSNSVYVETNTADHSAEQREHSGQDYEYAAALIAANTTNENEYNTLNETAKPIKADPNYDHIPKQSTSVNETSTTVNEDVYNSLNETTNCKGLNDPNYDHVSKQSPQEDQTYSHIKAKQSDHNQSKYQVHDTDMYSHLKQ